jgi:hypothetical protein
MREARLVLTGFGTIPYQIKRVQELLEKTLIDEYGGFISYPAKGGWRDDKGEAAIMEAVVYDVAIHQWQSRRMLDLAAWLREATSQSSVYYRDPWRDEEPTVLII